MTILMLGDIIGHPGMRTLFSGLTSLVRSTGADVVVINGENAADGFGLSRELAERLFAMGVDVITTGNHIWHDESVFPLMEQDPARVIRPANYPPGAPGKGATVLEKGDVAVGVLNLIGRQRLVMADCPFRKAQEEIRRLRREASVILVDFHAESPAEKEAMGFFLDGKVSAVVGTHTHIQTADEKILPGGTAYITDLGSTGPVDSVIGFDPSLASERVTTQVPHQLKVVDSPATICGVAIVVDVRSGKARSIERIRHYLGV